MSKKVIITLEFDHEDTTREEIKKYLKDLIEGDELQWEDNKEIMSEVESKFYDTHDTMDTTKLAKEIINGNNKTK